MLHAWLVNEVCASVRERQRRELEIFFVAGRFRYCSGSDDIRFVVFLSGLVFSLLLALRRLELLLSFCCSVYM